MHDPVIYFMYVGMYIDILSNYVIFKQKVAVLGTQSIVGDVSLLLDTTEPVKTTKKKTKTKDKRQKTKTKRQRQQKTKTKRQKTKRQRQQKTKKKRQRKKVKKTKTKNKR